MFARNSPVTSANNRSWSVPVVKPSLFQENPFQNSPPDEKLGGDLAGAYSRRINIQHRLVYQVLQEQQTVKVLRMWSHDE